MWFSKEEIRTKALQKLVWRSNNKLESKVIELFHELFETVEDLEVNVIPADVLNMLNKMFKNSYWVINDVRKLLKESWKLEPQKNSLAYIKYDLDHGASFYQQNRIGRYFTINKKFISEKFDELMN